MKILVESVETGSAHIGGLVGTSGITPAAFEDALVKFEAQSEGSRCPISAG
jgi:hypothetical protein